MFTFQANFTAILLMAQCLWGTNFHGVRSKSTKPQIPVPTKLQLSVHVCIMKKNVTQVYESTKLVPMKIKLFIREDFIFV